MATSAAARKAAEVKAKAMTEATEVTELSQWKTQGPPLLTLPSGKGARVRRVGMQAFMRQGMIPNSLMAIVQTSLDKGGMPENAMDEAMNDPAKIVDMLMLVDDVAVFCMIDPKVEAIPTRKDAHGVDEVIPLDERDESVLWVDELEDADKMYIFGFATGGTDDLAQFREQQESGVAAIQGR